MPENQEFRTEKSEKSTAESGDSSASNTFRNEYLAGLEGTRADNPKMQQSEVVDGARDPNESVPKGVLPSLTISFGGDQPTVRKNLRGENNESNQQKAELQGQQNGNHLKDTAERENSGKRQIQHNAAEATHNNTDTIEKAQPPEPPAMGNLRDPSEQNPMKDQDIGWWGDDHERIDTKDQFVSEIPRLKAQGVTTIAMELFTRDQQPLIDRFLASTDPRESATIREQLLKQLNAMWDPARGNETLNNQLNERIMRILDAAKANGLRVLALEPNGLNMRTGANSDQRDSNWERTLLTDRRQNPNARYVVFQGGNHLNYNLPFFRNVTLRTPQVSVPLSQ